MKINKIAKITNLPESTIRYYEKLGLLNPSRDNNNTRDFSEHDVEWIKFIKRLKDTGMPLKKIVQYSDLRDKGSATMTERLKMLESHKKYVTEQIKLWNKNLEKLDAKIQYYKQSIADINK